MILTILGVPPAAATMTILIVSFLSMFQHANVRTPRWLGYLVQRPESHTVHHARGIHRHNYADLPVFDLLFGTFRNPRRLRARDRLLARRLGARDRHAAAARRVGAEPLIDEHRKENSRWHPPCDPSASPTASACTMPSRATRAACRS